MKVDKIVLGYQHFENKFKFVIYVGFEANLALPVQERILRF